MKKLAILAALTLLSFSVKAQTATVNLNNFDANGGNGVPIYLLTSGTLAPTTGIFVQILGGPVGGAVAPVTDKNGVAIPPILMGTGGAGAGYFDAGVGIIPGVTGGAQAQIGFQAWQGTAAGGWAGATVKNQATTWTQLSGNWNSAQVPPAPFPNIALALPGTSITLTGVPEPSTIALGLLGGLALLIRRRK